MHNTGQHEHRPVVEAGQRICQDCRSVLVDPILGEDDPRFGKSPDFHEKRADPWWAGPDKLVHPPLPFVLVEMWEEGVAPPAPYIEEVCHATRLTCVDDWVELFSVLGRMVS